ncbi:hypothetical protein JB92DRAFT_2929966 [Gautieria morchelliformis]|nr:hypothetical protein JB92DRAFT_2929966 [Gautieria morchelliformis]
MDPQYLWKKLSDNIQEHAYEQFPRRLTLNSMRIEWERALVEGHPTHPVSSNIPCIYHY